MTDKKKLEVIKPGVRLEDAPATEKNGLKVRTGIRAGLRSTGLGCGGPNSCVAAQAD